MYKLIKEGKVAIKIPKEEKISKDLPVFYNPVMKFNRDVSVLLLKVISNKKMQIGLPLGGTGVRGVRFLKELPKSKVKEVWINDISKKAVKIIKENLKLNKVKAKVFNKDANMFMLESKGFDYIDIDPFGSPNVFLDSSIKRLGRNGILAVTATDTAALAGTYPGACLRKYWAMPSRDENMHENGLRILIRKVQLIGADHKKALIPIYSYFKDHYFRVFFRCERGRKKAEKVIKQHKMIDKIGPLWTGSLWDKKIAKDISEQSDDKFMKIISNEAKIPVIGFYTIPRLCKKYKLKMKKQEEIVSKIKKKGYKVSLTHFAPNSIRSNISEKELVRILK